jgi:hypothetical protein
VNRVLAAEGQPAANHKGVFRIMKRHGLLLQRHTGRRKGRLHDGKVVVMRSNLLSPAAMIGLGCSHARLERQPPVAVRADDPRAGLNPYPAPRTWWLRQMP